MHAFPTTKLRPPSASASAIPRPRLQTALDDASERWRATLLIAPAGYGKTTLVSSWLRESGRGSAWFTVDPGDTDAGEAAAVVSSWLVAALAHAGALSHETGAPGATDVSHLAAALEASSWQGVVVVDDAHHLDVDTGAVLATWVERAPEGVHTMVLARSTPPLPAARWLARAEVEVLGVEALRLQRDEGRALVATLLGGLDSAQADALVARVEGWPAGVQLAARSLRGKTDVSDSIERFTGTDRYVLAFLTEEVLLRLPDDLHEAALLLAGEPRLCAGLVGALTQRSDGAAVLSRLEAHEAFLERLDAVEEDGPWFRFPDFFRELLSHRLEMANPGLRTELATRSSSWWRQRHRRGDGRSVDLVPGAAGASPPNLGTNEPPEPLTERERQVLALLAVGAGTKAIARELDLSPNTVKTHTRHLFEKLGVSTRTRAAARARELGLV